MEPSSPDIKRPSRNLISTPGPNPIQSQSLYMTKDSACPLSGLMACTGSTGQEAGKISRIERSITARDVGGGWKEGRKAAAFLEISREGGDSDLSYASACVLISKEHQKSSSTLKSQAVMQLSALMAARVCVTLYLESLPLL